MKKTLLLIISITNTLFVFSQNVNIPDANFKAYLVGETAINTNLDTEIQVSEAQAFTGIIDVSSASVSDFTGLETFINITQLDCSGNNLTSIDISQNLALQYFTARNNSLVSIDLSANTQLDYLELDLNDLQSIDLSNNPLIEFLELSLNQIQSLDVRNLSNLDYFSANNNNITYMDITQNLQLFRCELGGNDIDTLLIGNKPVLEILRCHSNNLESINISSCPILTELKTGSNDLTNIDVTNCPNLTKLDISYNDISSINLSNNLLLERCYLTKNQLSIIDVSLNVLLEQVSFSNNNISSVDLSNLPNLRDIYILNCNNLVALNLANGNNTNIALHDFTGCQNLTCIEVDNVSYANTNLTSKDPGASYSLDCNVCYESYSSISASICEGEVYTSPNFKTYTTAGAYTDTLVNACNSDSIISIFLEINEKDSVVLLSEKFCLGNTIDFYGTTISSFGTYYHTLTNQNGCDSVVTKTFTELENTIINNNGTLEATSGFDTYQWLKDGTSISNETNIIFTPTENGDYSCEATKGTCNNVSNVIKIELGVGINELVFENLSIFPNPTNDILNIETAENLSSIRLMDLTGKAIKVFKAEAKQLNVSEFTTGIYFLEIANAEKKSTIKIIKR